MTENDEENNGNKLYAGIVKVNGQKWSSNKNITTSKEEGKDVALTDKVLKVKLK